MATIITTTFKLRRGNSSTWESKNPILAEGEPGYALDIGVLKIGDGITPWKALKSISGANIDPSKNFYTKEEIDEIIALTKASLIEAISIEETRAKRAEEANAKSIADILNVNTGILAQAKAYTDGALAAMALLQIDDETIKIKDNKAYVAKVSTDVLEQGEQELILCAGSSNI